MLGRSWDREVGTLRPPTARYMSGNGSATGEFSASSLSLPSSQGILSIIFSFLPRILHTTHARPQARAPAPIRHPHPPRLRPQRRSRSSHTCLQRSRQ
jgi:hypothetical protein